MILEIISELILELVLEGSKSSKIPSWLRYLLLLILFVIYGGIALLIITISYQAMFEGNWIIALFLVTVLIVLVIAGIVEFRKVRNKMKEDA